MPIRSMTGYGRAQGEHGDWLLHVELRSINHKGLDVRVVTPASLSALELSLREPIRRACSRGRVECRLSLETRESAEVTPGALSEAKRMYDALRTVCRHLDLPDLVSLSDLIGAGFQPFRTSDSEEMANQESWVVPIVEEAVAGLVAARETEGRVLATDCSARLLRIRSLLQDIEVASELASEQHFNRLAERLTALVAQLVAVNATHDERLLSELASFLDKSEITEEIVRAGSHVETLLGLFTGSAEPGQQAGKRIDFFLQELNREANTMAAKSLSAELTAKVVEVKVEVERLREQAQNIE